MTWSKHMNPTSTAAACRPGAAERGLRSRAGSGICLHEDEKESRLCCLRTIAAHRTRLAGGAFAPCSALARRARVPRPLLSVGTAAATPSYMSYFGLAWNIRETQDHVNLYWAVSWDWDADEVLSELADAKARGMRAIVHTEFAFFQGSGTYANACPYTLRPDAAARWDAFVQDLSSTGIARRRRGVLSGGRARPLRGIARECPGGARRHSSAPAAASKPVAVIFTCDIAQKYGGDYAFSGGHQYGEALRAYDWVGVDCYGNNIFTDPAWTRRQFDPQLLLLSVDPRPVLLQQLQSPARPASPAGDPGAPGLHRGRERRTPR